MFPKCQHYPIKVYNRVFFFLILIAVENRTVKKITTNWKILKKMEVADHLTCLLGNLYVDKKQQLELDIGLRTGKLGKEYVKAVYCHPAY